MESRVAESNGLCEACASSDDGRVSLRLREQ
jgi:hypothetical protein